jgi:hypothetical protein
MSPHLFSEAKTAKDEPGSLSEAKIRKDEPASLSEAKIRKSIGHESSSISQKAL